MKVIDLTHLIDSDMPVFPGTEKPIIKKANTLENDGFKEAIFTMFSHTGTHIDSPAHMLKNGFSLNKFDLQKFIGKATVIDFSTNKKKLIDINDLKKYKNKIQSVDFLIIKTGWSNFWGEKRYFKDFPSLSENAAKWITKFNLKGIGIDAISIDDMDSKTFKVHKILMLNNIIIIENLTNLNSINEEYFTLSIMPLKIKDSDGAPIRAVGIENI